MQDPKGEARLSHKKRLQYPGAYDFSHASNGRLSHIKRRFNSAAIPILEQGGFGLRNYCQTRNRRKPRERLVIQSAANRQVADDPRLAAASPEKGLSHERQRWTRNYLEKAVRATGQKAVGDVKRSSNRK
jgi:hypothetical protein